MVNLPDTVPLGRTLSSTTTVAPPATANLAALVGSVCWWAYCWVPLPKTNRIWYVPANTGSEYAPEASVLPKEKPPLSVLASTCAATMGWPAPLRRCPVRVPVGSASSSAAVVAPELTVNTVAPSELILRCRYWVRLLFGRTNQT